MEATPIIAVAAAAASAVYTKKSYNEQKHQIKADNVAAQKQYELDVAQRKLTLAEEQRKNRNLLRQQQSAYRARLGAAGMSAKSGSGRAVLDSLENEHDAEDKYLVNQANISLEALLNGINARNTRNLLTTSSLNRQARLGTWNAIGSLSAGAGRTLLK